MQNSWDKLDNAANIFPAAVRKADPKVFRLSCELHEEVDPTVLQTALDETMQIFRVFKRVLRKGAFWYYLEYTDATPVAHPEDREPCAPLSKYASKHLLFDVSYYRNSIHLEIYHVLADGTGALHFLQTLVTKYLCKKHGLMEPPQDTFASDEQMNDDSFLKYYTGSQNVHPLNWKAAYKLRGFHYPEHRIKVITGLMSTKAVLDAAHSHRTTLTAYLCTCLLLAIYRVAPTRAAKKPVVLTVPVNLRKHFPSQSARNFFSVLPIPYDFGKSADTFASVLKKVEWELTDGLSIENLRRSINTNSAVEHNPFARVVPLFLKNYALQFLYFCSTLQETAGLSNIGAVDMPKELKPYIRSFGMINSTEKLQACVCSFGDVLNISFTSPIICPDVQRVFFRMLTAQGIAVEINTNPIDYR
ncbi:hypothetical protein [Ethanoligenens sp.]|uniref:hypothetical protein n=1 Tax=Ethanoligenens sp. TaxID=2099655 RepID=UPI0039ED1309